MKLAFRAIVAASNVARAVGQREGDVAAGDTLCTSTTPTITGFSPTSAAPGSSVMIYGAGFRTSQSAIAVLISGVAASVTNVSPSGTVITVIVPNAGSGYLSVKIASVQATVSPGLNTYFVVLPPDPPPTGFTLFPSQGPPQVGVVIKGSGFGNSGMITFNGTPMAVTAWTTTSIVAQIPAAAGIGPGTIAVTPVGETAGFVTFNVVRPFGCGCCGS